MGGDHGHGQDAGHGDHGGHGGHDGGHGHGGAPCCGHGGSDLEAPLLGTGQANKTFMDEQSKLKKAVYFALFMMFVEIVGGIVANSLAIITDAAHMLSDVGGFIVSLVCLQLATQGMTQEYTYGFKQAEVLGALLSITIVWALTAVLLTEAVKRFYDLQEINAPYMFAISTLGFLVNLVLMKVLGHGHAHGGGGGDHGHSHGGHGDAHGDHSEDELAEEQASLAMRAAIAHVIGDIVQSLGVCLAALCIWTQPFDVGFTDTGVSKWNYADPMCTVLFGILVLFTTKSTLVQAVSSLMVKAPEHINQDKLAAKLRACPSVINVHDLHVWSMGSKDVLCTAHLLIDSKDKCTRVLTQAIKAAKSMGIGHSTFQIEIAGEFDPSLETYGLHDNPVPPGFSPKDDHGHGHEFHDGGDDHGHSHGEKKPSGHVENDHGHGHGEKKCSGHGEDDDHGHSHGEKKSSGHVEDDHGHSHGEKKPRADHGHSHGEKKPSEHVEEDHGHSHGEKKCDGHGEDDHGHGEKKPSGADHGHSHDSGHSHDGGHAQDGGSSVSYYQPPKA